jgi:Protein of unknown function (DUF3047)
MMPGRTRAVWVLALAALAGAALWANAGVARVNVGQFSQGDMHGWQPKRFAGETHYSLVNDHGRHVLRAVSHASASGLYRQVHINLARTPYLHWSWKVGNVLGHADERTRRGDDYAARVYVVFSGGLLFWRTRAIDYVWSSNQPVGSVWPNAFTSHVRMVAVESGPARIGRWMDERRDVRADYRRMFGADPGPVDAVAIMTDTDNTGLAATAWYGDIWFSAE